MNYPQPGWGPGQQPPVRRGASNSGLVIASIVVSCVYAAIAGSSLALTIVMALVAFALAGLALAAKFGAIKAPLASVSGWLVVVPALAGVLTLAFGIDRHRQRETAAPIAPLPALGHDDPAPLRRPGVGLIVDAGALPATNLAEVPTVAAPPTIASVRQALAARNAEEAARVFNALPLAQRRVAGPSARSCQEVTRRSGGEYSTQHDGEIVDWVVNVTAVDEATSMGGFMIVFKCGVPGLHLYSWASAASAQQIELGRARIIGRLTKNGFGVLEIRPALFVDATSGTLIARSL